MNQLLTEKSDKSDSFFTVFKCSLFGEAGRGALVVVKFNNI